MQLLPPLIALRAFEAAARHLSFKAAADELNVTPSSVSHQIKKLEDWLGEPCVQTCIAPGYPLYAIAPSIAP
jgi:hypothetical protein